MINFNEIIKDENIKNEKGKGRVLQLLKTTKIK